MAIYHHTTRMIGRSQGGSPVKALSYISGTQLTDERTGEKWDFKDKPVEEVQILLPENAPAWAINLQKLVAEDPENGLQFLSDMANCAEKRNDAQVYREVEFSLPRELTYEQNKALATEYVQDQFCGLGMLAVQSFHTEKDEKTGELNPHCHTFFLTRELVEGDLSPRLSEKKNREWNTREVHEVWREQWAQYASFHLKMHGHDITLDHRSYKDQGLDIEPQVKLGKGVKEQEKRGSLDSKIFGSRSLNSQEQDSLSRDLDKSGFVDSIPATDRGQELRSIQLRNLYRIMRRPETVFDIVTRHHATFMWGDVQKILGRYVDDAALFQRLDARLQNSKELLLLKTEGPHTQEEKVEARSIYTTRSMLKAEKELVGTAEALATNHTHAVSSDALENGIGRIKDQLQENGARLSEDQEQAIRHLVGEGQLKCVVGYAGAGKTTALEACHDIWIEAGYKVYGLAPTGRAAQNLEGSGIPSQTLHKFLKSFEEGRSQYSKDSILVLDEAGMVDVERFERLLSAVQTLGVKAVVVGDGAQLQPVEAGPAFRLVTERVGVSRLEEVVRQKEDWQREATVLFGRQESAKAIQVYQERGHIHLVEEKLPEFDKPEDVSFNEPSLNEVVRRYEMAARTSGLIYREMMREVKERDSEEMNAPSFASPIVAQHQDYDRFLQWRELQKEARTAILEQADVYKPILEARRLDPLEMARFFVDKKQNKDAQYKEAVELLKEKGLHHLTGIEKTAGQTVEVRSCAKEALIEDWKKAFQEEPQKSLMVMAYSNRDVQDLNTQARNHLKSLGVLGDREFVYTIHREVEDDFGRKKVFRHERAFSKGDRIVFTQNNTGLGVKNGTIGVITEINAQKIQVKVSEEQNVSFAPNLNPYFDQGWAVTIHKSQGTTVDKSFLLASHEMNQNLTYVAMTRHREDVHVYGSTLDFWRTEKVSDILSKSGEKLGAADYLDSASLSQLMKDEDRFLDKLFTRLGDELHAMGAVSKQAFRNVADHFLGRVSEKEKIILRPEIEREEARAQEILQKASASLQTPMEKKPEEELVSVSSPTMDQKVNKINTLQDVYEDMKHPAFKDADFYKRVFEKGLPSLGEAASIQYWQSKREPYMQIFEQKIEKVDHELQSPLLSYMSDESRGLARKAALEDPDKALRFLSHLQETKRTEQETRALQEREAALKLKEEQERTRQEQVRQENFQKAFSHYFRFRDLNRELEKSYNYDSELEKERTTLGKSLYKNKEVFEHIQKIDPEISKAIKQIAQEQHLQKMREMDRGGFSL